MPKDANKKSLVQKPTPKKKAATKPETVAVAGSSAPKRTLPAESVKPAAAPRKAAAKKTTTSEASHDATHIHVAPVSHHEVAELAYDFWSQRGWQHGDDLSDWVRAEQYLRARKAA